MGSQCSRRLRRITCGRPRAALKAICERAQHSPPVRGCSCGIYSARTLDHLQSMGYADFGDEETVIVGEVALWGTLIAATQGWRAEFAYPRRLLVPFERWRYVEPLRNLYGIPISLANTLTERA